jgi:hypothetical protein
MTKDTVLTALERGGIDPASFSHAAHVEAGWLLLGETEFGEAVTRMSKALRRLAAAVGRPDKYHETITIAFLALIAERRSACPADHSFADFRARNPDIFERGVLAHYYDRATLDSDLARRAFVLPRASQASMISTRPATTIPSTVTPHV